MKRRKNLLRLGTIVTLIVCAALASPLLLGQSSSDDAPPSVPVEDLPYLDDAMQIIDDALGPDWAEGPATPFHRCLDAAGTVCG
jgi:hypothetical protein